MGFLAPFIPQIIGLGGSLIGSLLGNKKSKSASSASTPLLPPGLDQSGLLDQMKKQAGIGDFLNTTGKATLGQGSDTLAGPLKYLQGILGGDRTSIMEAAAPEIAAINAQFQAPLTEANLMGRGTALLPDTEAKRQSAISNFIFQQRPQAADKLTGIAQNLMNLGTTQSGMGADIYGKTSGQLIDYNAVIRGLQAQGARDTASMYGQLGTSIGGLLSQILMKKPGGSSGGGTPPILPTPWDLIPGMGGLGL